MSGELVYLGIGSNLGDREKHIDFAADRISSVLDDFAGSSLYETLPMYRVDQPRFLNCVFRGRSHGSSNRCGGRHESSRGGGEANSSTGPLALLEMIRVIEAEIGRDRAKSGWMGPRPIDIDILLFGERVVQSDELTIPHPRMKERAFVLVPLVELAPDLRDPITGELYADLARDLGREGIYHYVE